MLTSHPKLLIWYISHVNSQASKGQVEKGRIKKWQGKEGSTEGWKEERKDRRKKRCWKGKKDKLIFLDHGDIFSVGIASFLFKVSPVSFISLLCQNILPQEQVSFHRRNTHASALMRSYIIVRILSSFF